MRGAGLLNFHGQKLGSVIVSVVFQPRARCDGYYFSTKGAATVFSTIISAKNSRESECNVTSQEISHCAA